MKILIIPDIHETSYYKSYLDKVNDYDKIIFLGDYFDYHGKKPDGDACANFREICEFKRKYNDKVDMLIGNHDNTYISDDMTNSFQYVNEAKIEKVLRENFDLLKIAVEYDGYVFSHAGISDIFLYMYGMADNVNGIIVLHDDAIQMLNDKLKENQIFGYSPFDMSGYGDDKTASPLWIRPNALINHSAFAKQVVGHTAVVKDAAAFYKLKDHYFIFTDTVEHNCIIEIDTQKEYEYKDLDKKEPIQVEKVEIIQSKGGVYNVFITYAHEFDTKVMNAYSIYGFETPEEAEDATLRMFDELRAEKKEIVDLPEFTVIPFEDK